jgi:hypothetical protein
MIKTEYETMSKISVFATYKNETYMQIKYHTQHALKCHIKKILSHAWAKLEDFYRPLITQ